MPRPLVPVIVILAGLALAREEATRPQPHAVSRSQVWHGRLTKRAEYTLTIHPDLTLRMDEAEFNRGEPRMDLVWEGTLDPVNGHIHMTHAPSGNTRDWGLCLGTPYSVLIMDEFTFVRLWERKLEGPGGSGDVLGTPPAVRGSGREAQSGRPQTTQPAQNDGAA